MPLQFQIDRFRPFLDRPHAYNFEANRLSTFEANPACFHACHISPGSFAKQGFYSTGNADEVKCYKCRQSHSNWQSGQELYRIHRQLSPICASFTDDDAAHQGVKPNIAIPLRQEDIRIHIGSLNGLGLTAHRIGVQESGNGYSDFSVHDDHNDIVVDFNVRLRSRRIVDNLQRGHLHSEFSSVWKREHTFYEFPQTRLIWSLKRHGFFSVGKYLAVSLL